jgi:hypothetical protein
MGGVTDLLGGLISSVFGAGEAAAAQNAPSKQAYGGEFADQNQTGYQAKAAKTARSGASGDTLLTQAGDLGNGVADTTPDTSSDLGGETGTAASEKQAEAGKRRDEIASKLYGK